MKFADYPFVKCLHPSTIVNQYTGEKLVVPCGCCKACHLNKVNRNSFLCDLESRYHKYTLFVTLTLSNAFINRIMLDHEYEDGGYYSKCNVIDAESGEILGSVYQDIEKTTNLISKCELDGYVGRLNKKELQKFLKRFRKYASEITKDKVRYFAVGEYGPVHFRPHYHLILWFESDELRAKAEEIVSKAWKFGRIDVSESKGQACNYVAGYVNSFSLVPEVLKIPACRPFFCHSNFLAFPFFKEKREEVYATSPRDFINGSLEDVKLDGNYKLPLSVSSYFYPKCAKYNSVSKSSIRFRYTLYGTAFKGYRDYEVNSVKDLCECITLDYLNLFDTRLVNNYRKSVLDFFRSEIPISYKDDCRLDDFGCPTDEDAYDRLFNYIYRYIKLSYHFMTFVCDKPSAYEIDRKLKMIDEFYSTIAQMQLSRWYESYQLYSNEFFYNDSDFYFMYYQDNITSSLPEPRIFGMYREYIDKSYNNSIKHRELNDLNRIFCDD